MLINVYSKIAKALYPLRHLFLIGIALLAAFEVYALIINPSHKTEFWLIPAALGILWLLLCYMLTQLFLNAPDFSNTLRLNLTRFARLKLRLKYLFYQLITLLYSLFTLALIYLSIRSIKLALSL